MCAGAYAESGYGFTLQKDTGVQQDSGVVVGTVEQGSMAEQAGMSVGQHVLDVNDLGLMEKENRENLVDQCVQEMKEAEQRHSSLIVTMARETAELCILRPNKRPLGFQIKGTCPVVVQKVDKGAAHNLSSDITSSSSSTNRISSCSGWTHSRLLYPEGRLVAGCGVHCTTAVQVEGDNMVQASHDKVVDAIKTTLSKQGGEEPSVTLKIGLQMVEHVHRYNYESTEDSIAHIQASCMDSRYTYSLPSQVSLHYIAHCEYN